RCGWWRTAPSRAARSCCATRRNTTDTARPALRTHYEVHDSSGTPLLRASLLDIHQQFDELLPSETRRTTDRPAGTEEAACNPLIHPAGAGDAPESRKAFSGRRLCRWEWRYGSRRVRLG